MFRRTAFPSERGGIIGEIIRQRAAELFINRIGDASGPAFCFPHAFGSELLRRFQIREALDAADDAVRIAEFEVPALRSAKEFRAVLCERIQNGAAALFQANMRPALVVEDVCV